MNKGTALAVKTIREKSRAALKTGAALLLPGHIIRAKISEEKYCETEEANETAQEGDEVGADKALDKESLDSPRRLSFRD
jgi:hypothetical protein